MYLENFIQIDKLMKQRVLPEEQMFHLQTCLRNETDAMPSWTTVQQREEAKRIRAVQYEFKYQDIRENKTNQIEEDESL
jgi:hypothetical protein